MNTRLTTSLKLPAMVSISCCAYTFSNCCLPRATVYLRTYICWSENEGGVKLENPPGLAFSCAALTCQSTMHQNCVSTNKSAPTYDATVHRPAAFCCLYGGYWKTAKLTKRLVVMCSGQHSWWHPVGHFSWPKGWTGNHLIPIFDLGPEIWITFKNLRQVLGVFDLILTQCLAGYLVALR